jgi:hypothetical protein
MEVSGQLDAPSALPKAPTEQEVGWVPEPIYKILKNIKILDHTIGLENLD